MGAFSKTRPRLVSQDTTTSQMPTDRQRRIAVLALPKTALSDLAGPYEAFLSAARLGQERLKLGWPYYEVTVLSIEGSSIATLSGLRVDGASPFGEYKGIPDTLVVAGEADSLDADADLSSLFHWVCDVAAQSRRGCSVCTGVFCLAQAGVLDQRRVTTHWQHAADLAHKYSSIHVDHEPLFLRDGKFYTSAGCTGQWTSR